MFPTFISILDIQSWWEVPSIAHFCSLFRTAFNLLDFDIEDLEEALLTDGTEEHSWLQELIVRLLSGCLPNNEISTFNYQMFLRRLFRQKCQEHDCYNPFNTDVDFSLLPLRTKVDILHALCDFRLDADDVLDQLKNLEADSLRVEPLGYDSNKSAYWYFYGTRLYREDFKTKNNKKKSIWQVICFTEEDWFQLTKKFNNSSAKAEKSLYYTLSKNFLPELPRLFKEKERQARRRLLENQPRRTSNRLRKLESEFEKELENATQDTKVEDEEKKKKREQDIKRREAYERRSRQKVQSEQSGESHSEETVSEGRYEMAKKSRGRQRKISSGSSNQDNVATSKPKRNKKISDVEVKAPASAKPAPVGRQTNNSLAAADGQIVIQQVQNPKKKKLKTSQVFRQTDEDLQVGMHKILDFVKNHEDAWPFADPVEEEYAPNYYTIVRKPMDLQRMEERLDSGYYKTFSKFRNDFQLIVDNCRLYNGAENEYTEMVDNLLQVFERATEKYLDQISSSDDEIAIEYLESETGNCSSKRKKSDTSSTRGRKPALVAQTGKKRELSLSDESLHGSESHDLEDKIEEEKAKKPKKIENPKKPVKISKKEVKKDIKENKKEKKLEPKKEVKTETKKEIKPLKSEKGHKKTKKQEPVPSRKASRSRSRSRSPFLRSDISSPPPSWPPSSPDTRFDFSPKKQKRKQPQDINSDVDDTPPAKAKQKPKSIQKDLFEEDSSIHSESKTNDNYSSPYTPIRLSPKPKDKHNKLRETIEKLKAKSDITRIKTCEYDLELDDVSKENKDKNKKVEKVDKPKIKPKEKVSNVQTVVKPAESDVEDTTSVHSDTLSKPSKKHLANKQLSNKIHSNLDALSIATEQTLKDINKWLDDTPKFAEFSSASNSPSYGLDEFDSITGKNEQKKFDKPPGTKKDGTSKDSKKRLFRDPSKFFNRKREVQRTIDRLQPGKSKGNLISNVPNNANKVDEIFPLGPLSKIKDTKNALIVKTDTNAPKLSLGSVLDSFGKHKFVDDQKKEEIKTDVLKEENGSKEAKVVQDKVGEVVKKEENEVKNEEKEVPVTDDSISGGGATPNLSAWFKAFGAPKAPPPQKKSDIKPDGKENEREENINKGDTSKVSLPDPSPSQDSPQLIPRQRRISTGSSMSERSSFSQDMDSPRVGMDERGAYPAPYPSPLHKSPSGASPVMASPRPDFSPKSAAYPAFNGQIRVGFYQDTVSNKSSPDKSCSPRDNLQSPYGQYSSDHVYAPNTTQNTLYSYAGSPYYTHTPNYSSTNPTPPYNTDASNPSYYDTTKSISDTFQAKGMQNYTANSPASNEASPVPLPRHSPSVHSPHSPIVHPQMSPSIHSQHSPSIHSPHQHSPSMHSQCSPSVHSQHSPSVHSPHPQNSPINPQQNSPINPQSQLSPGVEQYSQQDEPSIGVSEKNNSVFPVKKRAYNDSEQQMDDLINRNLQVGQKMPLPSPITREEKDSRQYIGEDKPVPIQTTFKLTNDNVSSLQQPQQHLHLDQVTRTTDYAANVSSNQYNPTFSTECNFPLNIQNARSLPNTQQQNKLDMSKFTNMGYSGPEVNFTRALQQQYSRPELNYTRTTVQSSVSQPQQPSVQSSQGMYKNMQGNPIGNPHSFASSAHESSKVTENVIDRLSQIQEVPGGYKPEMTLPRASYNTSTIDVDQPLSLGRNLSNLSHIVDRYGTGNEDQMMARLQNSAASSYYTDKGLGTTGLAASHMFNKTMTSTMFSQANMAAMQSYNQSMQAGTSAIYSRQMEGLQNSVMDGKSGSQPSAQEKKTKKRKSSKTAASVPVDIQQPNTTQGFQSYAGLKTNSSIEPSAISLKTSSVVPGSAFNFGPTPTGLGLYGDKDAYSNFLDDFRTTPNYYMAAAAAAHHRSTPEANKEPTRAAHQSSNPTPTSGYPFLNAHQARPAYPIGGPFIPPAAQAQLMDTSSPLYQHYLQAGVLNQGLLGPPGAYPPGYHPALSMRQPYDPMNRPSWI